MSWIYGQGLNENTAGIEVVNEARPSDQEDGTNIPLVKQVLLLDPDEINKDMETCTNTLDKIKLWGMKRYLCCPFCVELPSSFTSQRTVLACFL